MSAKSVHSSNEPDNPLEANLTPSQCVTVYKRFMQPNYGTVQLGTPAVTNRGGPAGLTYLEDFVHLCVGCAYNFVNVHFFVDRDQMNVAQYIHALKVYIEADVPAIQAKHKPLTGLPIAIGEVSNSPPQHPLPLAPPTDTLPVLAHGRLGGRSRDPDGRAPPLAGQQCQRPLLPSRRRSLRGRLRQRRRNGPHARWDGLRHAGAVRGDGARCPTVGVRCWRIIDFTQCAHKECSALYSYPSRSMFDNPHSCENSRTVKATSSAITITVTPLRTHPQYVTFARPTRRVAFRT